MWIPSITIGIYAIIEPDISNNPDSPCASMGGDVPTHEGRVSDKAAQVAAQKTASTPQEQQQQPEQIKFLEMSMHVLLLNQ